MKVCPKCHKVISDSKSNRHLRRCSYLLKLKYYKKLKKKGEGTDEA